MNEATIGLGSNVNPKENIEKAIQALEAAYSIKARSSFIVTKPVGNTTQPDFLNGALLLETELSQEEMRKALKEIELSLGRNFEHDKWGPRTIDLDIIIWNGKVVDSDFYERDFVKNAVLELLPSLSY